MILSDTIAQRRALTGNARALHHLVRHWTLTGGSNVFRASNVGWVGLAWCLTLGCASSSGDENVAPPEITLEGDANVTTKGYTPLSTTGQTTTSPAGQATNTTIAVRSNFEEVIGGERVARTLNFTLSASVPVEVGGEYPALFYYLESQPSGSRAWIRAAKVRYDSSVDKKNTFVFRDVSMSPDGKTGATGTLRLSGKLVYTGL